MPETIADRFAAIIELLCQAIAEQIDGGRHPWVAAPVLRLAQDGLRGLAARFAAAVAALTVAALAAAPPAPRPRRANPPRGLPGKPAGWRQVLRRWLPIWMRSTGAARRAPRAPSNEATPRAPSNEAAPRAPSNEAVPRAPCNEARPRARPDAAKPRAQSDDCEAHTDPRPQAAPPDRPSQARAPATGETTPRAAIPMRSPGAAPAESGATAPCGAALIPIPRLERRLLRENLEKPDPGRPSSRDLFVTVKQRNPVVARRHGPAAVL